MCTQCAKMRARSGGVYGFDFGGITDAVINTGAAYGGYVVSQTVDNTVSMLKDNPKNSGMIWTGGSILLNIMFPQIAANKMLQSATIGMGIFGMKRLNEGYKFLKNINGMPNFANTYQERMARAQAVAMAQGNAMLPQNRDLEMAATPPNSGMMGTVGSNVSIRLAA